MEFSDAARFKPGPDGCWAQGNDNYDDNDCMMMKIFMTIITIMKTIIIIIIKNTDDNHNNDNNNNNNNVAAASDSLQVHKTCVESKCKPSDFAGESVCVHLCACGCVFERVCVPSPSTLQI